MPLRRRLPLVRSCQCKLPGINRPVGGSIGGFIAGGGHGAAGNGGPGVSGQIRIYGSPGSVRNVATKSPIWRLGRFVPEWAAQGAKAQIPGSARSVRQRAFGRPRRIPGGALHIRDQLHLVSGKLGEGQADHYIFPPVPCPVIDARGDLDDRESRWQNRQTAMLARTRPGPAGARGTPGRALGWCAAIYTKPSYSPLDVALAASCILGHRIQLHPLDALSGATSV